MDKDWLCYHSVVNDQDTFFGVDKDLAKKKSNPKMLWIAQLSFNLKGDSKTLPSDDEFDKFIDYLYKINHILKEMDLQETTFAGFWLRPRHGEIFYYLNDKELPHFETTIHYLAKKWHRKIAIKIQKDPTWSTYFEFLHPSEQELKVIDSEENVRQLYEQDIPLNRPYLVDHRFYFHDEESMMACLAEVDRLDMEAWKIESIRYSSAPVVISEPPEKVFLVVVEQRVVLREKLIHDTVSTLYELVDQFDGTYIHWQPAEGELPEKQFH